MELLELLYIALGTVGILVLLHLGTFWVARIIQPAKPKIVYVRDPAPPAPAPIVATAPPPAPIMPQQAEPPPILSNPATNIQLPTYDTPPSKDVPKLGALPPPIETRNTTKQSGGDIGPPR